MAPRGQLDQFQDYLPPQKLPGCCRIPRDLMAQVEANFAKPLTEQRSIASCARWLASEGHPINEMLLRNHVRNGHVRRFE
ncbi:MAG TPA: hypothetical protein VLA89_01810 [Gemmatimonadales bacterium]|nr:hypothetical protein [Gemmatimonadales bacterium]